STSARSRGFGAGSSPEPPTTSSQPLRMVSDCAKPGSSTRPTTSSTPGGVVGGIGLAALGWSRDILDRRLAAIGETLTSVYREADEHRIPTSEAAQRLAATRLGS